MMRCLFSAVAGLRTHQTRMDVIGDNIANVNTVGFKKSSVTFRDVYYQTLRGGSASGGAGAAGGTNPQQIGLGVALGSIDVVHTQGAAMATGNGTDLMIQGDGFFRLKDAIGAIYYTRAGVFHFDGSGYLVNPDGLKVLSDSDAEIQIDTDARSYNIDKYGVVRFIKADGTSGTDQTIGLSKFPNPSGLEKIGQNLYRYISTGGAGSEVKGKAGSGSLANTTLIPSALEMSNVELAQEFSDMIVTQRGFQANARTITTSDEMLQELVNLKR